MKYLVLLILFVSMQGQTFDSSLCGYQEQSFEENFNFLNQTRWDISSINGAFHFDEQNQKTMATSQYLQFNSTLPNYPGNQARGLTLRLSQQFCLQNPGSCCSGSKCAYWAGAHMISKGCIGYGKLEVEASIQFPADGGAFAFLASYINQGSPDSTWNEIDIGWKFSIGNQTRSTQAFFSPNLKGFTADNQSSLSYNDNIANQYHNYSVIWNPNFLLFQIDNQTRQNISGTTNYPIPWRCQTLRVILRTNTGNTNQPGSDSLMYWKKIRFTSYNDMLLQGNNCVFKGICTCPQGIC